MGSGGTAEKLVKYPPMDVQYLPSPKNITSTKRTDMKKTLLNHYVFGCIASGSQLLSLSDDHLSTPEHITKSLQ